MPLLDHFHPPLYPVRHWEAFHSSWANAISDLLNKDLLPQDYFAEPETHASGRVEIDVAAFDKRETGNHHLPQSEGGVAVLPVSIWSPPEPAFHMPAAFTGAFRVQIFRNEGGAVLVGAIELISPSNKDRSEQRRMFAAKCASYLAEGVGLVIVDIVTNRHGNLHNEFVALMHSDSGLRFGGDETLYAAAYRPIRRGDADLVDVWPSALSLGKALPILPLHLRELCVPVDLESTYAEACRRLRLS